MFTTILSIILEDVIVLTSAGDSDGTRWVTGQGAWCSSG